MNYPFEDEYATTDTVVRDYDMETTYAEPSYAAPVQVPVTRLDAGSLKPVAKAMKQLNKAMREFGTDVFTVIGVDLAYTTDVECGIYGDPTALRFDWDMIGEEFVLKTL